MYSEDPEPAEGSAHGICEICGRQGFYGIHAFLYGNGKNPEKERTEKRFHQIFYQRGSVYHPFCAKCQYIKTDRGI